MGIEKKTISIRLDDEMIRELQLLAKKENRNFSNLVETILKKYLEEQK